MEQVFTLEAEAGQISAELARRGVGRHTRVHVSVTIPSAAASMAAIAQQGQAFDWLDAEPDLYSDADLSDRPS
jgi:hypothetical protein